MSEVIERALHGHVVGEQLAKPHTRKDFISDMDPRWCPGCGDYSILAQVQRILPELGIAREDIVWVSGIGCSSRFPYYVNTYGFHGIHGRAPAIASGIKTARPKLQVWVATGDGDGLAIGGNHFIHTIRRNVGIRILLFNNRIYGLTKGQYSPTTAPGTVTRSSPLGTIDHPFNPVSVALGSDATFVARAIDADARQLQSILRRMAGHEGTAFLEIFQNCLVFNDDAFTAITEKRVRAQRTVVLEHGKPLLFANGEKGVAIDAGMRPIVIDVKSEEDRKRVLVHDERAESPGLAFLLSHLDYPDFPVPFGVFRAIERPSYERLLEDQMAGAIEKRGDEATLEGLIYSGDTWKVES